MDNYKCCKNITKKLIYVTEYFLSVMISFMSTKKKNKSNHILLFVIIMLLSVGLIVFLSAMNTEATTRLSMGTLERLGYLSVLLGIDPTGAWWYDPRMIRRLAHIPEYFILGVATFAVWKSLIKSISWSMPMTFITCVGISYADQCFKARIPGREYDPLDFPFDLIGYVFGLLIAALICSMRNNK